MSDLNYKLRKGEKKLYTGTWNKSSHRSVKSVIMS